jgi:hypothetical protein
MPAARRKSWRKEMRREIPFVARRSSGQAVRHGGRFARPAQDDRQEESKEIDNSKGEALVGVFLMHYFQIVDS